MEIKLSDQKASATRFGVVKPDSNDFNMRNGLLEADEALYCNEGLLSDPTITDATGVAISLTSVDVLMHSDSTWGGKLYHKTVPANTSLSVTDNSINYIYVDWNDGNPIYAATTDRDTINNSNAVPVSRIYMSGGNIEYQLDYDYVAKGATIRNFDRVMRIRGVYGMERESGLAITETATRVVNIAAGYAWFGVSRKTLAAIAQGGAGVTSELWYHSGGNWTSSVITAYNNTQYDNGTDLATLTANRYAVNWIFRNITTSEIDIVLGTGDYTLAQAESSLVPALPTAIANFYILCGRIIVKKSVDTAYAIETVSSSAFDQAAVSTHSDLGGLTTGDDHTQYFYSTGETSDQKLYSGADLIVYSDAGSTEVARIDGATGNITTSGTVDGVDLAGHAAATEAHGATGAVVGTTNTQELDNKTLDSSVLKGTFTASGTVTLPAVTHSGNITMPAGGTVGLTGALITHTANAPDVNVGTGSLSVTGSGAYSGLTVSTTSGNNQGSRILMKQLSASPANNDIVGLQGWQFNNSAAALHDLAYFYILATNVTADAETAKLVWNLHNSGADNEALTLTGAGTLWVDEDLQVDEDITVGGAVDITETLTDGQYSGITCAGVAGATVAFGDLIYLSETDQRWELTDATTTATSTGQLGICLSAGTDGTAINVLLYGYVCETDWDWNEYVVDKRLYISETAGDMSQYVPLTDAAVVRIVGYVHDDGDTIFFDPAKDWYEIDVTTGAAASVDAGDSVSDRATTTNNANTYIIIDNPVNATGIIDTIKYWCADALTLYVGTFYGSGTTYTCRDYVNLGTSVSGSEQTVTGLSLHAVTGDYLGFFGVSMDRTTGVGSTYYKAGAQLFTGVQTYTAQVGTISLYAEGVTKANTIVSINGMDIA
jgi:hypothetical protein